MRYALIAAIFLLVNSACAVDPSRLISRYGHDAWRIKDGYFRVNPPSVEAAFLTVQADQAKAAWFLCLQLLCGSRPIAVGSTGVQVSPVSCVEVRGVAIASLATQRLRLDIRFDS